MAWSVNRYITTKTRSSSLSFFVISAKTVWSVSFSIAAWRTYWFLSFVATSA
jgi:hypothetical protein